MEVHGGTEEEWAEIFLKGIMSGDGSRRRCEAIWKVWKSYFSEEWQAQVECWTMVHREVMRGSGDKGWRTSSSDIVVPGTVSVAMDMITCRVSGEMMVQQKGAEWRIIHGKGDRCLHMRGGHWKASEVVTEWGWRVVEEMEWREATEMGFGDGREKVSGEEPKERGGGDGQGELAGRQAARDETENGEEGSGNRKEVEEQEGSEERGGGREEQDGEIMVAGRLDGQGEEGKQEGGGNKREAEGQRGGEERKWVRGKIDGGEVVRRVGIEEVEEWVNRSGIMEDITERVEWECAEFGAK
jgi:hypothetical protein